MRAAALGPLAAEAEVRQVVEVVGAAGPPEDSVPAAPAPVDAVCLVPADRQLDSQDADPPCNVRIRAQRKIAREKKKFGLCEGGEWRYQTPPAPYIIMAVDINRV